MIGMSTKQKIILRRYRDGDSERKISRELKINRETVRRYLSEYEKARLKLSNAAKEDEALIEELVKAPKYDSSTRSNQKFTEELSQEVERLLQINDEKRSRGLHKQVMKQYAFISIGNTWYIATGYTWLGEDHRDLGQIHTYTYKRRLCRVFTRHRPSMMPLSTRQALTSGVMLISCLRFGTSYHNSFL